MRNLFNLYLLLFTLILAFSCGDKTKSNNDQLSSEEEDPIGKVTGSPLLLDSEYNSAYSENEEGMGAVPVDDDENPDEEYYEDEEDMYETWDDEYWNDEGEWDDEVADYETPSESSSSSPNGTYKYSNGDTEVSITIIGNMWSMTSKLCLYCDVEYVNGVFKGNKLYDSSGYIEVGYTDNNYLSVKYASQVVTLTKK